MISYLDDAPLVHFFFIHCLDAFCMKQSRTRATGCERCTNWLRIFAYNIKILLSSSLERIRSYKPSQYTGWLIQLTFVTLFYLALFCEDGLSYWHRGMTFVLPLITQPCHHCFPFISNTILSHKMSWNIPKEPIPIDNIFEIPTGFC